MGAGAFMAGADELLKAATLEEVALALRRLPAADLAKVAQACATVAEDSNVATEASAITVRVVRPSGVEVLEAVLQDGDMIGLLMSKASDALGSLQGGLHFTSLVGERGFLDADQTVKAAGLADGDFVTAVAGDLETLLTDAKLRVLQAAEELDQAVEELDTPGIADDASAQVEAKLDKARTEVSTFKGLLRSKNGGWDIFIPEAVADIDLGALFSELREAWKDGESLNGGMLNTDQSMETLLEKLVQKLANVALKEAWKPGASSQEAVSLLARWEELYFQTRSYLEQSGDHRWEFNRLVVLKPARDAAAQIREGQQTIQPPPS